MFFQEPCSDPHLRRILRLARRQELFPLFLHLELPVLKARAGPEEEKRARDRFEKLSQEQMERELLFDIQAAGSHGLVSLFRRTGVPYPELLRDTLLYLGARKQERCKDFLKLSVSRVDHAQLLQAEKELFKILLESDEIPEKFKIEIPDPDNTFYLYRFATILAAGLAGRVAGRLLIATAELLLSRALPSLAGPAGAGLSLLWLLHELASPAMRKIIPLSIHLAMLDLEQSVTPTIGVLGSMSAGKDTLIEQLFGVETKGVSAIPGSTREVQVYEFSSPGGRLRLVNAPGSGDPRQAVAQEAGIASDLLDTVLLVFNAGGHLAGATELALFQKLQRQKVQVLPVLNKIDLCRSTAEASLLQKELADRLKLKQDEIFMTAARPHQALGLSPQGLTELWQAVRASLAKDKQSALMKSALIGSA